MNNNMENEQEQISAHEQAQNEDDARLEKSENLITEIITRSGNDFTVVDCLLELLELFVVKESKVSTIDLAEELQPTLFAWTRQHDEGFENWRESVLTGEYKTASETSEGVQICPSTNTPSESTETDDLAKQISDVLKNPNLPVELYNAILEGADDIINTTPSVMDERFETSPEYIKAVLKMSSNE
jgi:hypothetical protein